MQIPVLGFLFWITQQISHHGCIFKIDKFFYDEIFLRRPSEKGKRKFFFLPFIAHYYSWKSIWGVTLSCFLFAFLTLTWKKWWRLNLNSSDRIFLGPIFTNCLWTLDHIVYNKGIFQEVIRQDLCSRKVIFDSAFSIKLW